MAEPLLPDIQSLLRRMHSGRRVEQLQAAAELEAIAEASGAEECSALVAAGCVPPLLQLLRSSSLAVQARVAGVLGGLTAVGTSPVALAAVSGGGGVAALVPLLGSSSEVAQENAAWALGNLATSSAEDAAATVAAGGTAPLLRLLSSSSQKVQQAAAYAICSLISYVPARAALAADGAFPALLHLLGDRGAHAEARSNAASALANLVHDSAERRAAAVAAGVPAAMVRMLRSGACPVAHEAVASAMWTMAHGSDASACAALAEAGAIEALAERLSDSGSAACFVSACRTLSCLARESPERCHAVVATGCVPRLVQLLGGGGGTEVQAAAADALCFLSDGASTTASSAAILAAGGLPQLVAVLQSCNSSMMLDFAAVTLHNIASDGFAEAAVAAGAVPALQQLQRNPDEAVQRAIHAALAVILPAVNTSTTAPPPARQPASDAAAAAQPASQRRPPRVCAAPGCGATTGLRRCGGCVSVRYCSEACSRAHWRVHKAEFRRLQAERALAAQQ